MGVVDDVVKKVLGEVKKLLKKMMEGLMKGLITVFSGIFGIFGIVLKPISKIGMKITGSIWKLVIKFAPIVQFIPYLFLSSLMMPLIIPIIIISMALSFVVGKYVLLLPFIFMFIIPIILGLLLQTAIGNLKKVDWGKEVKKIMKGSGNIIKDIMKLIITAITDLFKKIL